MRADYTITFFAGGPMARVPVARALLLLFACLAVAPCARAQYDVEESSRVWVRALLDVRIARGGSAPSWTDSGPGKTRYGGESTSSGFEPVTRYVLAEFALELGATLPWNLRAQVQLNVQPDLEDGYEPWIVDAWVRREWAQPASGWGLQAGVMNVPFSLEHLGPAWSPQYSLTASALNSWLWDEISLAGLQGEWWYEPGSGPHISVTLGTGFGPDRFGRLLALRGWAMGDGLSGVNADLPLPNGTRMDIYHERDDRPSAYAWIGISDPKERGGLRLGYFDNFGNQGVDGAWHTRFTTAGAVLHPVPRVDFIAQYLYGEAYVRGSTNDSSMRAFYALLSPHFGPHRLTLRYDEFRVHDLDGGNPTAERGDGFTFAYLYEWGLRHRLGVEYIRLNSERPGAAVPEPDNDGWQVSYRYRY